MNAQYNIQAKQFFLNDILHITDTVTFKDSVANFTKSQKCKINRNDTDLILHYHCFTVITWNGLMDQKF